MTAPWESMAGEIPRKMSQGLFRCRAASYAALTAALVGASFCPAPTTRADPGVPLWNGKYTFTSYLEQKGGTSLAADQPEDNSTNVYTMSTSCSAAGCVATVVDGPLPKNPTLPPRAHFTWDGTQWATVNDWQWDCLQPGGSIEWNRARSWANYLPQLDGTLLGTQHNEIYSGTCEGTVDVQVVAIPAQSPGGSRVSSTAPPDT